MNWSKSQWGVYSHNKILNKIWKMGKSKNIKNKSNQTIQSSKRIIIKRTKKNMRSQINLWMIA